jgi:hypothetical protein
VLVTRRPSTNGHTAKVVWPGGKAFAFTVFDDPDCQTVHNGRPVYDFLTDHGFRTTKAVWPLPGRTRGRKEGTTCDDPEYQKWVTELRDRGFEIALHNVTYHTSDRGETIRGLDRFAELFSDYPRTMANHTGCRESIYWGNYRLTGLNEILYNILLRNRNNGVFQGHVENSPFFWGDACRERITYVRNFVFGDINTLGACPYMPYHDRSRPYVNHWFSAAEGGDLHSFINTLSEANQDRLVTEGGACILYTHFGKGFYERGQVQRRVGKLLERLSRLNGWFVPVSTLLDYLREVKGVHHITDRERRRLESRWLWEKIWRGTS